MEKIRYKNLDILKFVASIVIIFIHVPFPGTVGLLVKSIARVGVPIFFMTSGYFSYNLLTEKNTAKLKRRIFPLIKYFSVSFLIYMLISMLFDDKVVLVDLMNMIKEPKELIKVLLLNFPISQYCVHLWFLLALIYIYILLILAVKVNITKFLRLSPALLLPTILFYDFVLAKTSQLSPLNFHRL